jgi:AcrR family transcriptional regulator
MSTSVAKPGRRAAARRPRHGYHHGDLRRALVDAALELARRHGTDRVTIREAAHLAGVSQTAPYRHFTSRDALLAAIAEEAFEAVTRHVAAARDAAGSHALDRFREMGLAAFEFYVADAARFRLMFGAISARKDEFPTLAQAWRAAYALLTDGVLECQRVGCIREGDPAEIAVTVWATIYGLAALVVEGQVAGVRPGRRVSRDFPLRAMALSYLGLRPEGFVPPPPPNVEPDRSRDGSEPA